MSKNNLKEGMFHTVKLLYLVEKEDTVKKVGKEIIELVADAISVFPTNKRHLIIEISPLVNEDVKKQVKELVPKYLFPYVSKLKIGKEVWKNKKPYSGIPLNMADKFKPF